MEGFHHQKRWVSSRKQGNILHGWWFQGARGVPLVSIFFLKVTCTPMPPIHIFLRTNTDFIHRWQIHLFYTFNYRWLASKLPILYYIQYRWVSDRWHRKIINRVGKDLFLVAKCLTCSIPYLPVAHKWSKKIRIPLHCGPMTSDWIMVLFFPSKKSHETSRNLWSHISLYPMIIPWLKPMILVFHLCPGSQVNDSFSHDRRDVMELIEAVLSGQVHPRQIPLIRVAWHLGDGDGVATQCGGLHQEIWWSVVFFVGTSIQLV